MAYALDSDGAEGLAPSATETPAGDAAAQERDALHSEAKAREWRQHDVNIRVTMWLPFVGRKYLVVLAGDERRSDERLASERQKHPLMKWWNAAFLMAAGTFMGLTTVGLLYAAAMFFLFNAGTLTGVN